MEEGCDGQIESEEEVQTDRGSRKGMEDEGDVKWQADQNVHSRQSGKLSEFGEDRLWKRRRRGGKRCVLKRWRRRIFFLCLSKPKRHGKDTDDGDFMEDRLLVSSNAFFFFAASVFFFNLIWENTDSLSLSLTSPYCMCWCSQSSTVGCKHQWYPTWLS